MNEVAGYSGEVVELKDGKFRYWFYTDVSRDDEPKYPLSGEYRVSGDTLTLVHDQIYRKDRTIAVVNGADVLWRDDGLKLWKEEQRIHPYSILIRMPGKTDGSKVQARPSLDILYTREMKDRENREHEERYNDKPAEVRALLRARSHRPDPDLAAYKAELRKAQESLTPSLIRQLVALMSRHSPDRIPAKMILADLYGAAFLLKKDASYLDDPVKRRHALECLIEGVDAARDRTGVEEPLQVFLQASGARQIDLTIPEAGVYIRIKVFPDGCSTDCSSIDARGSKPKTVQWTDEMPQIIPAVQRWMRDRMAEQK